MTTLTLFAARNLDFAPTINVDYPGDELPLAGATITMQVRQYPGASGEPNAQDAAVVFSDESHPTLEGYRRLAIAPSIPRSVLETMPGQNQPDPGAQQRFVHEIKITYADAAQDSLLSGDFFLSAGVDAT